MSPLRFIKSRTRKLSRLVPLILAIGLLCVLWQTLYSPEYICLQYGLKCQANSADRRSRSRLTTEFDKANISNSPACIHHGNVPFFYQSVDPRVSPTVFHLKDDNKDYFTNSQMKCLKEGTDIRQSLQWKPTTCKCKPFWYGQNCAIPEAFKEADLSPSYKITLRKTPRRIIHAFPFNIEFDMLETTLSELGDVVDVFIVSESNYSAHGDPKPLRLLERLRSGFCRNLQHKLVYVYVDHFPKEAYTNGWIADDLPRNVLGTQGLSRQIKGAKHDDIFILTDADELPMKETLLFIKLHDGFPEPFGFHLHRTIYGFFWLSGNGDWRISSGSTIGMLNHVFHGEASKLRNPLGHLNKVKRELNTYINAGGVVHLWYFGNSKVKCGWHCSWCLSIPEIRIKLVSAINGDFPRWGDYPEKRNETYIKHLVKHGLWFNGERTAVSPDKAAVSTHYRLYAPKHMLHNYKRFEHILRNPFI